MILCGKNIFLTPWLLFFGGTGIWTQDFAPATQELYRLSHNSSAFCCSCFGDGGLRNYLPDLASNCDTPDLSLLSSYDYRFEPPAPSFSLHFFMANACTIYRAVFLICRRALNFISLGMGVSNVVVLVE
jgi:hypothetical protein